VFRKTVSGIMLILLLTSMLTLAFDIQPVKAGPKTWYVDDSGGADFTRIQDAIYAASAGDTIYVYNGTYYEHIYISKSLSLVGENKYTTIIDGSGIGSIVRIITSNVKIIGFTIRNAGRRGGDWDNAINLESVDSCCISDNLIMDVYGARWSRGIDLYNSRHNVVMKNTISNIGDCAIWTAYGFGNTIVENTISNSKAGIYIGSYNDTIVNNIISNCSGDATYGIIVWGDNNKIIDNVVTNVPYTGIRLNSPSEYPNQCTNNVVSGNVVSKTNQGIAVGFVSSSNTITRNNASDNDMGLFIFDNSDNNTFTNNYVSKNYYGITLFSSDNTKLYHNNFIDNTQQVLLSDSFDTTWDDGYPSGGNYWSDYTDVDSYNGPYQNETGNDGIWDHPYVIDESNRDHYPFTPSDISIVSVEPSSTEVYVGQIVSITVTVQNEGNSHKTFDVTCKYELEGVEHTIGIQTINNLAPNTTATLTFTWTTTDITVHTIKAEIPPLIGETDTADNTLTSPTAVKVKMIGDVNGDDQVDISDIYEAALAFGSYPGHPEWDPNLDLDGDDTIDIRDIYLVAINFGKTHP